MSPRTTKLNLAFLIAFCLGLAGCKTIPTSRYFDPEFVCNDLPGFKNQEDFSVYRSNWQKARDFFRIENTTNPKADVVFIGNSLIMLYHKGILDREFPNKNIANRGIGGDMTDLLLERIEQDALILEPKLVILEIGGNDLIQKKCLPRIESNIIKIHNLIAKRLPKAKVIHMGIPPTRVAELNMITPVLNSFLSTLPSQYPNVVFIDTWNPMRDSNSPILQEDYSIPGDMIHFNDKGYEVWSNLIRRYL
jgi:lysophospholipase L1-like esterase